MPTDQQDPSKLQITSPDQWKKPTAQTFLPEESEDVQGFVSELPSGNVAKLRRTLDLPLLLHTGQIPNPLSNIVRKMIDTNTNSLPSDIGENPRALFQFLELIDQQMTKCFVEPKVSAPDPRRADESDDEWADRVNGWKPDEGTIAVHDISIEDKMYVFSVAQGAAADLARFREEQARDVAALSAGEDVPLPSKRTGGPNREQRRAAAKKKAK